MHSPETLAFEIKYPWRRYRPWPIGWVCWDTMTAAQKRGRSEHWPKGYRDTFICIWHIDPERDGSDDSCGWSYPKLTDEIVDMAKREGRSECGEYSLFRAMGDETFLSCRDPMSTVYQVFELIAWRLFREQIKAKHLSAIISAGTSSYDGFFNTFEGPLKISEVERAFCLVTRSYLRITRPWYKHPRWHIHHWRIQVRPMQQFKRWAFSRCSYCRKHFTWGYSPISGQWNGPGPRWFRNEPDSYHHECHGKRYQIKMPKGMTIDQSKLEGKKE